MTYIKRVRHGEMLRTELVDDLAETALQILQPYWYKFQHPSRPQAYPHSRWTISWSVPDAIRFKYKSTRPDDAHLPNLVRDLFAVLDLSTHTRDERYRLHFTERDLTLGKFISKVEVTIGFDYFSVVSYALDNYVTYHSVLPYRQPKGTYLMTDYTRHTFHQKVITNPLSTAIQWSCDLTERLGNESLTIYYWTDYFQQYRVRDLTSAQTAIQRFLNLGVPGEVHYQFTDQANQTFLFHIQIDELGHYTVLYEESQEFSTLTSFTLQWVN